MFVAIGMVASGLGITGYSVYQIVNIASTLIY